MSEWTKYTGNDEQIDEMFKSKHGYIALYSNGEQSPVLYGNSITTTSFRITSGKDFHVTHYLLCEPHPLADMIIRQAETGQPVWIRPKDRLERPIKRTRNILWDYAGYEFSFTPFEEQKCEE